MSDTGDVEVEIEVFGDEVDAVFKKGGKVYIYEINDEIAEKLDNLVPGWYTVYSQIVEENIGVE